ncbi:MAG: hypothetical protein M3Z09_18320 [Acidobacteriota bacterium]|nr:hypothetical protein [Acidobacteriota bacterium]
MQRLRASLYLKDKAIHAADLTQDGRHVLEADAYSWHLLTVSGDDVLGCARYLQHRSTVDFDELKVNSASLAKSPQWGEKLRAAVEAELKLARMQQLSYVEMGGWAISERIQGTSEALRSVLATFAWGLHIGGALGLCTATERNGSASILRRLGGRSLEYEGAPLPAYYDEQYRCNMEVLRFSSGSPNPRYVHIIEELRAEMPDVPVVWAQEHSRVRTIPNFAPSVVRAPERILLSA